VYLLDTTVWIDLLRTNSPAIRRKLTAHTGSRVGLSIITLCELQYVLERRAVRHPHLRTREQHMLSAIVAPILAPAFAATPQASPPGICLPIPAHSG